MKLILVLVFAVLALVAGKNLISVVANVRGRKFDLKAATVSDFMSQVEKLAGLTPGQQSVLFRGKLLGTSESLSEAGVSNGDVLNVLKGRRTKIPHKPAVVKSPPVSQQSSGSVKPGGFPSFPGFGMRSGLTEEQMKDAQAKMEEMLSSGFFDELFNDPEKLEMMRVQLKNNLDQYDKMMPGMREQMEAMVATPEVWNDAMAQAKKAIAQYKILRDQQAAGGAGKTNTNSPANSRKGEKVEEPKDEEETNDE